MKAELVEDIHTLEKTIVKSDNIRAINEWGKVSALYVGTSEHKYWEALDEPLILEAIEEAHNIIVKYL
jgi:hypothetical protein